MSIWTRTAESISAIGDSIGEFLQRLTRKRITAPEKSIAFTIGMIALSAKMAKADGIVSEVEINAFKQVFHVPEDELAGVARVFNLAKQDIAGFDAYARQVSRLFHAKASILEDVLEGLFHIAKADEAIHTNELLFLEEVATIFGFSQLDFDRIKVRHVRDNSTDPYRVLGLDRGASEVTIKQRYRKLVRDNHPDKHIAAGVPEEMVSLATERLQRINEAYDTIMKERAA